MMRESTFQTEASIAAEIIGEQVVKYAHDGVAVEEVLHDYFSKLERGPSTKQVTFYLSKEHSAWEGYSSSALKRNTREIVWCIRTCDGFTNEWLVMRSSGAWECGDFSIVDLEFIKGSLVEYCPYYKLGEGHSMIIVSDYEYKCGGDASQDGGSQ